jgi:hypothetical protein
MTRLSGAAHMKILGLPLQNTNDDAGARQARGKRFGAGSARAALGGST